MIDPLLSASDVSVAGGDFYSILISLALAKSGKRVTLLLSRPAGDQHTDWLEPVFWDSISDAAQRLLEPAIVKAWTGYRVRIDGVDRLVARSLTLLSQQQLLAELLTQPRATCRHMKVPPACASGSQISSSTASLTIRCSRFSDCRSFERIALSPDPPRPTGHNLAAFPTLASSADGAADVLQTFPLSEKVALQRKLTYKPPPGFDVDANEAATDAIVSPLALNHTHPLLLSRMADAAEVAIAIAQEQPTEPDALIPIVDGLRRKHACRSSSWKVVNNLLARRSDGPWDSLGAIYSLEEPALRDFDLGQLRATDETFMRYGLQLDARSIRVVQDPVR
jgi:hypothetical protein